MKKNWFTFIEILIAILVFSIWVFAVLSLMTSNLRWLERNDLRLQGTLFAKEWLELVYNLRDSNLERELPWNCILNDNGLNQVLQNDVSEEDLVNTICDYFGEWKPIKISYDDWYVYVETTDTGFDNNILYYHDNSEENGRNPVNWYSHEKKNLNKEWEPTVFARYITFDWIFEQYGSDKQLVDTWKIMKVSSHVIWQKWWYTWEVVLSSFIWNY